MVTSQAAIDGPLNPGGNNPNWFSNAAFAAGVTSAQNPFQGQPFGSGYTALSLANGMTAGAGVLDGVGHNPMPYNGAKGDSTIGGNPATAPYRIGVMRNVPGSLPPLTNGPSSGVYELGFMFNPNDIAVSFATNNSSAPPTYLYGDTSANLKTLSNNVSAGTSTAPTTVPNFTNSQTVTWSLLFDRTLDMYFSKDANANRGVLIDVAMLYNIMGTFESIGAVPISTPVQVVFGQTANGQLWGFTGFINNVAIQYGNFRKNMLPSQCVIQLSMQCVYVAPQVPSANAPAPTTSSSSNSTPANPLASNQPLHTVGLSSKQLRQLQGVGNLKGLGNLQKLGSLTTGQGG